MLITCNQSCRAVLILLTAVAGPPQICPPGVGREGSARRKAQPFSSAAVRGELYLCLPEQLYGNNSHWRQLFSQQEGGGGGCPVGEGPWGLPRAGASSWGAGRTGSPLQLLVSSQGLLDALHSQDETSCPLVPPHLPRLLSPPLLPLTPHGARSCHGVSQELPGGCLVVLGSEPCPGSCPLCCLGHRLRGLLAISYSSHVLLPRGGRATAGAPKWLQSLALRHGRRGSGTAAARGADCQTKGR